MAAHSQNQTWMLLLAYTPAFTTKPKAGPRRAEWWPRSSDTRASSPPCRLHRDQPEPAQQAGDEVLQRARHRRAEHQGRQECDPLGPAVPPCLPAQRRCGSSLQISPISCAAWAPPDGRSSIGHSRRCARSWSKIGAQDRAADGGYVVFQLAEVAVTRIAVRARSCTALGGLEHHAPPLPA